MHKKSPNLNRSYPKWDDAQNQEHKLYEKLQCFRSVYPQLLHIVTMQFNIIAAVHTLKVPDVRSMPKARYIDIILKGVYQQKGVVLIDSARKGLSKFRLW